MGDNAIKGVHSHPVYAFPHYANILSFEHPGFVKPSRECGRLRLRVHEGIRNAAEILGNCCKKINSLL
jgi:hypothetical protein